MAATNYDDGLLGTFNPISEAEWEVKRNRLEGIPLGPLWLEYEEHLYEIQMLEWYLGHPEHHVAPEDVPGCVLKWLLEWDEYRQLKGLYEEVMREKGWDGEGMPRDVVPHCNVCRYPMSFHDRRHDVCDECEMEMWRDQWREEMQRERRWR
jgi:hypothetical protein